MDKKTLLNRLYELNEIPNLNKVTFAEYLQIIRDLQKIGVPTLSQTLINENDRNLPIEQFSEIPIPYKQILEKKGIKTLGHFLDLFRTDLIRLPGVGNKKWSILYGIQKELYNSFSHKDVLTNEVVNVFENDEQETSHHYTIQELIDINEELMAIERESIEQKGWNSNKYQDLNNKLLSRGQKRSEAFKEKSYYDLPVDVLDLSVRLKRLIEKHNIEKMIKILDLTRSEVFNTPNMGIKCWKDLVDIKQQIINNSKSFLEKYEKEMMLHEFPEEAEENPLYERCFLAINQMAAFLETQNKQREAYIIKEYFIKGTDITTIANKLFKDKGEKLDRERVRQLTVKYQQSLISGSENLLIANAFISDDLLNDLKELIPKILYRPTNYANQCFQAPEDIDCSPILRLLNLDVLTKTSDRASFMDVPRVISSEDEKSNIASHIKALHFVMGKMARPGSKEEIIQEIINSENKTNKFDIDIIERILDSHSWVETDGNKYSYLYDHLDNNIVKAARIIYEERNITTSKIKEIDQQRRKAKKLMNVDGPKIMAQFPWVSKGARYDEFLYMPERVPALKSLSAATEEYAKEHIVFNINDMIDELKKKGYGQYADGSFHTYVRKYCVSSKKDGNILCLESEIDNNDRDLWRSRTISGTTNWIINSCVQILSNKKLKQDKLRKSVLKLPEADNYKLHNFTSYLVNYTCSEDNIQSNKLFINNENGEIWVNQQCLDEGLVDLATIGFANRQPDYYMDVLTEIVNQLKKAPDNQMLLSKMRDLCLRFITHPSKQTVFYKITNKLPSEVEKVEIDKKIYLQLRKENLQLETAYVMPAKGQLESANIEIDAPQVVEKSKPEGNYIRGMIDWKYMAEELKQELCYYNRWWDLQGLTLDEGVDHFVELLNTTDDTVLHKDTSRHIFEFLTQKVDKYDLHDHLRTITLALEPILKIMYMKNNHKKMTPPTFGLNDCISLMPELKNWVDNSYTQSNQGFNRIFKGFYNTRNKFAHGSDIEMNTVSKYQASYGYLALYIYIYNKFSN